MGSKAVALGSRVKQQEVGGMTGGGILRKPNEGIGMSAKLFFSAHLNTGADPPPTPDLLNPPRK